MTLNNIDEALLKLSAVRDSCLKVKRKALKKELQHFDVDETKMDEIVMMVKSLLRRDYDDISEIPVHGRWRHFGRRVHTMISQWESLGKEKSEITRRVLDLFVVAVLLDVEFDHEWTYTEKTSGQQRKLKRMEGTAVATLYMFQAGNFSSDKTELYRVDAVGLLSLSLETLEESFCIKNNASGPDLDLISQRREVLHHRLDLLHHLGNVLQERKDYFGGEGVARPGNLTDYLLGHASTTKTKKGPLIQLETMWPVVMEMGEKWAATEGLGGTPGLGDVWACKTLGDENNKVAFHKLSQWLVYSLIEPLETLLGATIEGSGQLTPLPDSMHGGLLIDTGFLKLKEADYERGLKAYLNNSLLPGQPKVERVPMFELGDGVVIEWRALTIAYVEDVTERIRQELGFKLDNKTISRLIEGGTWSAGREYAEISRPNTHEPPIVIKVGHRVIC